MDAQPQQQRRSLFGDVVLLAFLAAQFCDGAFTYLGVHHFGRDIEANPIVGWYIAALGIGYALLATKAVAVACAAVLHLFARHHVIAVLTIFYIALAITPWVHLLAAID
jgi:nitrate reductase gamma subunit